MQWQVFFVRGTLLLQCSAMHAPGSTRPQAARDCWHLVTVGRSVLINMSHDTHCVVTLLVLPMQVPLKRVNQVYVIATSTKVDIKGVDISKIDDAYFKAAEEPKKKKGEDEFFKADAEEEKKVRCS